MSKLVINDREWFKKPCKETSNLPLMLEVEKDLIKELSKHPTGIGLAANQIGYDCKVAVIKLQDNSILTLMNASIVSKSKKTVKSTEGCLSFPGTTVDCRRHSSIVVKATEVGPEVEYVGMDAIVIQHELGHLNGKTMFDCKYIKSNGKFTAKKKRRKR